MQSIDMVSGVKFDDMLPNGLPPTNWMNAPRPNYEVNEDLKYAYAETPDLHYNSSYEFEVQALQGSIPIVDYYGEGYIKTDGNQITGFKGAYNVNWQYQCVSNGPDRGKKIPNRIPVNAYNEEKTAAYIRNNSCDAVTIMNAPITDNAAIDMTRIVNNIGKIIAYDYSKNDPQAELLAKHATKRKFIFDPTYALTSPFNKIVISSHGSTSYFAFRPVQVVRSEFVRNVVSLKFRAAAAVLQSMYADFGGVARPFIKSFLDELGPAEIFPVVHSVGVNWASNRAQFVADHVSNSDLRKLLMACWNGNTVRLSCWNSDLKSTVYLNGTGKLWSGGPSYHVTTDEGDRQGAHFDLSPTAEGAGIRFSLLVGKDKLYLNGKGELWSGGPSYWASTDLASRSGASFTFNVVSETGAGLAFTLATEFGLNYLNGMGQAWSGGPSYYVSTDLKSRRGITQLVWNVA
ncbi:hypothetical protein [Collimonas sp. OK412]|jgi:hypothetical protein|uniref:hypothetical protein n=1 Tax=Collimonas sp. (strain OK412) TaxID=1801619 RepID=UPI0008E9D90F|nr:hypothetical protein [Collimonas sp. OK412]SFB73044.1 hypothetical protein SAMN04515619_101241 [Collimonas sp. OK412]